MVEAQNSYKEITNFLKNEGLNSRSNKFYLLAGTLNLGTADNPKFINGQPKVVNIPSSLGLGLTLAHSHVLNHALFFY